MVIGAPKCDTCGKGHLTERCLRNTGACVLCGSMELCAAACPRNRGGNRTPQQPPSQQGRTALPSPPLRLALPALPVRQQQRKEGKDNSVNRQDNDHSKQEESKQWIMSNQKQLRMLWKVLF